MDEFSIGCEFCGLSDECICWDENPEPEPDTSGYCYTLVHKGERVIALECQVNYATALASAEEAHQSGEYDYVFINEELYGQTLWRQGEEVEDYDIF